MICKANLFQVLDSMTCRLQGSKAALEKHRNIKRNKEQEEGYQVGIGRHLRSGRQERAKAFLLCVSRTQRPFHSNHSSYGTSQFMAGMLCPNCPCSYSHQPLEERPHHNANTQHISKRFHQIPHVSHVRLDLQLTPRPWGSSIWEEPEDSFVGFIKLRMAGRGEG